MSDWLPFEEGKTIGIRGTEGGTVIADEQHDGGARITLEENCLRAPYAITCVIYGWAYHTRFLADQPTARKSYDDMKVGLEGIVKLLGQTDLDVTIEVEPIEQAVEDFVAKFP